VLYEMLTGRRAFEGKSQAGVIAAVMEHETPSLMAALPAVGAALDWVVRRCLNKDPDERWQTA
jgi:eukaryotic-like serine/threonine-protein kinase